MHLWCMVFRQSSKFISHFLLDQGEKRQYDTEVIWGLDDPGTDRNHYFSLSSRPLEVNQTELLATWSPASPHKVWFLCWEVPRVHCFCQWCWAVNRWLSLIDGGCSRWLLLPGVGKVWLNHWWRSSITGMSPNPCFLLEHHVLATGVGTTGTALRVFTHNALDLSE